MEDGHKVLDPLPACGRGREDVWGFFAVYDGHGGREEVAYCESKLHDIVAQELRILAPVGDVATALTASFKKVDGQLAMLGAWNSGCTATVALVHRQGNERPKLYVANVGDSRAALVGHGCVRPVSTDHRAADPAEQRRVAEEGGVVRHGRVGGQLSVSRSLGDHHLKGAGVSCVPSISVSDISDELALVIASDGLWDALNEEDVRQALGGCVEEAAARGGGEQAVAGHIREQAARTLVARAKERGSRDNILALVAFF